MAHITIVPYNPEWQKSFEIEAQKIKTALGNNCIAIHHIGSTSVPGLAAKPIIDIMPVGSNITLVNEMSQNFEALGYEPRGEYGISGRRYCQ